MVEALIAVVAVLIGLGAGYVLGARSGGDAELAAAKARLAALEERAQREAAAAEDRERRLIEEHERYVQQVRSDEQRLAQHFRALSADALAANQQAFLDIADQRLARAQQGGQEELARREAAVRQLVEPMREALQQVQRQTTEADRARAESQAAMTEQIRRLLDTSEQLGRQTESLRSALRRPEVRGRWGELHLRRVVEVAGLVNGVDFDEQVSGTGDDGTRLRPDMIVTLAGGRRIVVDAKTPLDALLDMDAEPEAAAEHAARHVRNVRQRVKELSSKSYRESFGSDVDFSVLFLPAESFLQVATEHDPQLLSDAYESGVIIATPTVLVAMLRTVAHTWRTEALAQNAQEVLETGQELYKRMSVMGEHLARLGRAIDQAGDAYNKTVGSMERSVLPQARRFASLQRIDDQMETRQVETEVRDVSAPELLEARTADARD